MLTATRRDPVSTTVCLVRFIAGEVNRLGVRARLVEVLDTDYKRLNRYCTLVPNVRPARDLTFTLEILGALGFDPTTVLSAAATSSSPEEMIRVVYARAKPALN